MSLLLLHQLLLLQSILRFIPHQLPVVFPTLPTTVRTRRGPTIPGGTSIQSSGSQEELTYDNTWYWSVFYKLCILSTTVLLMMGKITCTIFIILYCDVIWVCFVFFASVAITIIIIVSYMLYYDRSSVLVVVSVVQFWIESELRDNSDADVRLGGFWTCTVSGCFSGLLLVVVDSLL